MSDTAVKRTGCSCGRVEMSRRAGLVEKHNPKVCIVGSPNVGKSVLFGKLCDKYAMVSNYPGTTVEVTRGEMKSGKKNYEVIDTPGMYSFNHITQEEEVAKKILINPGLIMVKKIIN